MQSKEKIPELFGSNVFNEAAMQQYVSGSAFQTWKNCLATVSYTHLVRMSERVFMIASDCKPKNFVYGLQSRV